MRKIILISIVSLVIFAACKPVVVDQNTDPKESFYVGTYTGGESEGIYEYAIDDEGMLDSICLAASTSNPSFLSFSKDRKYLLAVGEHSGNDGTGLVSSFLIEDQKLKKINEQSSGGASPCFIVENKKAYVLSANYTGGSISLHQRNRKGQLSPLLDLQQHIGSGTSDRQKGPHAHSVWLVPNSEDILAVDLGTNELWIYQIDEAKDKLVPTSQGKLAMKDGAGPRHLTFHPKQNWIYVINELDNTVTLVKKDENESYYIDSSFNTLPIDFKENNSTADIHISKDGLFLYASNRGHNSLAIFAVNQEDGNLTLSAHQSVFGKTPRNFALSPDENFILVANQNSNNIVAFKRDKNTGLLTKTDEIKAPVPVCIKF